MEQRRKTLKEKLAKKERKKEKKRKKILKAGGVLPAELEVRIKFFSFYYQPLKHMYYYALAIILKKQ